MKNLLNLCRASLITMQDRGPHYLSLCVMQEYFFLAGVQVSTRQGKKRSFPLHGVQQCFAKTKGLGVSLCCFL